MTFTSSQMVHVIQTQVRQAVAWRSMSEARSQSFGTGATSR